MHLWYHPEVDICFHKGRAQPAAKDVEETWAKLT